MSCRQCKNVFFTLYLTNLTSTLPGEASVSAITLSTVSVLEGQDVNITCFASGNPIPTITWTLGSGSTPFSQTNTTERVTAYVTTPGSYSFSEGNITSTLHITSATYPSNDGVYTCSASNSDMDTSASITVEVQGRK